MKAFGVLAKGFGLLLLVGGHPGVGADPPASVAAPLVVKYIGSSPSVDESYYLALIRQALELTRVNGPYRLEYTSQELSSERKQDLLVDGKTLNIDRLVGFEDKVGLRRGLIRVNQPLLFGFMGYRVPLIRADKQPLFNAVQNIEQLKQLSMGLGKGWEGYLYRQQGFPLVEPISMSLLLKMLAGGRFDYVPLSAIEIEDLYTIDGALVQSLKPEQHLLIHLRQPVYFYVSPNQQRLARRLEHGIARMRANGSLWQLFCEHFCARLQRLKLDERRVIEVPNPEDNGSLDEIERSPTELEQSWVWKKLLQP